MCKYKDIKRRSAAPQRGFWVLSSTSPAPTASSRSCEKLLIWPLPKQGHYLQLLLTSKTHERAHTLDCGLTLPQTRLMSHYLAQQRPSTHKPARKKHFSPLPRKTPAVFPGEVWRGKSKTTTTKCG